MKLSGFQPLFSARIVCTHVLTWVLFLAIPAIAFATSDEPLEAFTEPYRDIDVASSEMGVLTEIQVKEGERVKVGQQLAQLDDSIVLASLDIVKAEADCRGRLDSALAEFELQSDLVTKLQDLLDRKHANAQEVARAITQKDVLSARVKAVREELVVKSYELRRSERQLKQRRINSPIDGIVTRVPKEVGEFVSPNDPVVAKVVQLDPLLVLFSVPLSVARELKNVKEVGIHVESSGPLKGEIEFISPTVDVQSGTTRVRVKLPNPNESIACGVPCQLLLPGKARTSEVKK